MLTATVRSLARTWPFSPDADAELQRALTFLGSDLDGTTVERASNAAGIALVAPSVLLFVFGSGTGVMVATTPPILVGVLVLVGGPWAPRILASAKRSRALGVAPFLITRATVSMELYPVTERAATVAATATDGPLGRSLDRHVRRAVGTPESGFRPFAREWRPWFPALERACSLVETAAREPPDERTATLERARRAVLDAARDRMADFGAAIRGPTTALYAFGVLLPLALVSLLPALGATGVGIPVTVIALVYDLVLPVGLACASAVLLARRPVAFPAPALDHSHPDVDDTRRGALVAGSVVGLVAWSLSGTLITGWTRPLAAAGFGTGVVLVVTYHPIKHVRDRVRSVEAGLSDALAIAGRRIQRGNPVESVLPVVADETPGATGDVFEDVTDRCRSLGVDVDAAMFGPNGALATVPSPRVRSAGVVLALASTQGQPTGRALVVMASHLEELAGVEREARRSVQQVTHTLWNTGAFFGPLVGGATVSLAGTMGSSRPLSSTGDVGLLGLVVGVYVLILATVLTLLATGLSRGLDRALVGYRTGIALVSATSTYLLAVAGTGVVV